MIDQFEHIGICITLQFRLTVSIDALSASRPETKSCLFCGFSLGPLGAILPGTVTMAEASRDLEIMGYTMAVPWEIMGYL